MRGISSTIAVGVDGSAASLNALRWAVDAAASRPADLIAVIAAPRSDAFGAGNRRSVEPAAARAESDPGDQRIDGICRAIDTVAAGAPVQVEVLRGNATEVLLAMTDRVDLLVVGNHGYHGWRDALVPSLSGKLAVRTRAALCVVQDPAAPPLGRIVVGHDATTGTAAAQFAANEARLRGASVLFVASWHYPWDTRPTSVEAAGILEEGATAAVAELAAAIRLSHPEVTVDTAVRLGQPVEVLAEYAGSADMVVMGSHGGGGPVARLVVGSVAIGLLHRLRIPVLIVPNG